MKENDDDVFEPIPLKSDWKMETDGQTAAQTFAVHQGKDFCFVSRPQGQTHSVRTFVRSLTQQRRRCTKFRLFRPPPPSKFDNRIKLHPLVQYISLLRFSFIFFPASFCRSPRAELLNRVRFFQKRHFSSLNFRRLSIEKIKGFFLRHNSPKGSAAMVRALLIFDGCAFSTYIYQASG